MNYLELALGAVPRKDRDQTLSKFNEAHTTVMGFDEKLNTIIASQEDLLNQQDLILTQLGMEKDTPTETPPQTEPTPPNDDE